MPAFELDPLIQIMAEAIDPVAFSSRDELLATIVLQRRNAVARARAAIRSAQASGWRFVPPGDFEVMSAEDLDATCERAKANLKNAADVVERP